MLIEARTLMGFGLECQDGDIGTVTDALVDDRQWSVRYLVADAGGWLPGRTVLIAPHAVRSVSSSLRRIGITVTRQQIAESPALLSHQPVSRTFEAAYCAHFRWPLPGGGSDSREPAPASARDPDHVVDRLTPSSADRMPKLRSARDIIGHHIHASDGEIGRVEDVIIDDWTWAIRYLVADTQNWWPGAMVMIAPAYIERVRWDERTITVSLTRAAISTSRPDDGPSYDPDDDGDGPHRHGDHARPGPTGDAPGMQDADLDPGAQQPRSSAPSTAMARIIDQARDPDHVIVPIAGNAHHLGQDDLDELLRRQLRRHRTSNPGAQDALPELPGGSRSTMPPSSDSASVPAARVCSHARSPDHDRAGGP